MGWRSTPGGDTAGVRRGNEDAADYAALAAPHVATLLRVATALVGADDAEDAAQEALLRGWQAWETLREPEALRAWLVRIAVNVCRQWHRGRFGTARRSALPLAEAVLVGVPDLPESDPGGDAYAGALDLRRALAALDEESRLVVTLRYYAGMDSTAIGAALGMPPPTVRTRLRRALALLRDQLAEHEPTSRGQWEGKR